MDSSGVSQPAWVKAHPVRWTCVSEHSRGAVRGPSQQLGPEKEANIYFPWELRNHTSSPATKVCCCVCFHWNTKVYSHGQEAPGWLGQTVFIPLMRRPRCVLRSKHRVLFLSGDILQWCDWGKWLSPPKPLFLPLKKHFDNVFSAEDRRHVIQGKCLNPYLEYSRTQIPCLSPGWIRESQWGARGHFSPDMSP